MIPGRLDECTAIEHPVGPECGRVASACPAWAGPCRGVSDAGDCERAGRDDAGRGGTAGWDGAPGVARRGGALQCRGRCGLHDRPKPGRPPRLGPEHMAELRAWVLAGPDVETSGTSAWTLADVCRHVEARWGVRYHEGHMSKLMKKLGLSWQKTRPSHPKANPEAKDAFVKGGCKANSTALPRSIRPSA